MLVGGVLDPNAEAAADLSDLIKWGKNEIEKTLTKIHEPG